MSLVYVSNRQSLPCFIGPVFSIVVLWNVVFCLSTNQTAGLFKLQNSRNDYAILNMYVDIVWLNILIANKLIKCFCLVIVRYVQLSLGQLYSKILETPITQKKFYLLSYWTSTCRRRRFLWFHHCQYVGRTVGKPFSLKRLIEFFWNFSWS